MFTDRDLKDDKESLTQRALRLEERNARAASASKAEGERKEESMFENNRPTFATSTIRSGPGTSRTVPDSFAPQSFTGTNMDADAWLAHFQRYTDYRQLSDNDVIAILPLFLKEVAIDWYENLPTNVKQDRDALISNFKTYFGKSPLDYVFDEESVFSRTQKASEKVRDYVAQMQKLAKRIPGLDDDLLIWVIVKGLRPFIKASVIQHKAEVTTLADLLQHAKLAESAGAGIIDDNSDDAQIRQLRDEIRAGREEVQQLNTKMSRMTLSAVQQRSPTPTRRPKHVSFCRDGDWEEQRVGVRTEDRRRSPETTVAVNTDPTTTTGTLNHLVMDQV